jgi:aldehyde dehydrogenase (NAD+)
MCEDNERELCDAVFKDLKKHPRETYAFELAQLKNDLALFIKNLSSYMAPEKVPGNGLINIFDYCEVRREPYGVALVIGACRSIGTLIFPYESLSVFDA